MNIMEDIKNKEDIKNNTNDNNMNENIKILMRQTTYTEEECKLKLLNKSLEQCIKEYLGVKEKISTSNSVNQNIYRAIREFF